VTRAPVGPGKDIVRKDLLWIHYRRVKHRYVVEVIEFEEHLLAIRGGACRGADA